MQRMTQTTFKCFADLLHSCILPNQERIGLYYFLSVHFLLLILERGLHLQGLASLKLTLFKHTCLDYNTVNEDRQFSRVIVCRR